jgi:UDPglucose--hexose-1-phosphate uridylyltransferase
MIEDTINELISYAKIHLGMNEFDSLYFKNILLGELGISKPSTSIVDIHKIENLMVPDSLLDKIKEYLVNVKKMDEISADLFITKLMGFISPNPSKVVEEFNKYEKESPKKALDYLYDLSIKNNYVQKTKIDKNLVWETSYPDKNLEISINLSKPEKNNKDIAKLVAKVDPKEEKYPKCLLCLENLGFYGNSSQPARENIRLIPLRLGDEDWYLQYSPYGYFHMHCICFAKDHANMLIDKMTFVRLCEFVDRFPCFFIGSNADLPIVGGSILNHNHFQGGEHLLPVMKAKPIKEFHLNKYPLTRLYKLDWYNTCLMLESKSKEEIVNLATEILNGWRTYKDPVNEVYGVDLEGKHNTITPSIRKVNETYYLYLILRNNKCTPQYPDGIFHAHKQYHMIKKEGIGIIEAMGLFILPARLVRQSTEIKDVLLRSLNDGDIIKTYPDLEDFIPMIHELERKYNKDTIDKDIREYIDDVCKNILINTAVFKDTIVGKLGLDHFIGSLNL